MFRSNKPKVENFRADYATPVDFCDIFRNDTKHLYLLAFLLTTNHRKSEQCFVSTVEKAFKEQAVFKEWVRSRIKRTMIENARSSPRCAFRRTPKSGWGSDKVAHDTRVNCRPRDFGRPFVRVGQNREAPASLAQDQRARHVLSALVPFRSGSRGRGWSYVPCGD